VQRPCISEKEIAEVPKTPYRRGMLRGADGLVPTLGSSDVHSRLRFVDHRLCSIPVQVVREVLVFQVQGTLYLLKCLQSFHCFLSIFKTIELVFKIKVTFQMFHVKISSCNVTECIVYLRKHLLALKTTSRRPAYSLTFFSNHVRNYSQASRFDSVSVQHPGSSQGEYVVQWLQSMLTVVALQHRIAIETGWL